MSLKFALHALVIGYALSLMGCASTPAPLPPELQYREPAPEAQAGTIIGFQVETTYSRNDVDSAFA